MTSAGEEAYNAMMNPENAVEIRKLSKRFGSKEVLKDINLDIKTGENLVVLGKSGTGKSVLIKCIIGLIEPDHGVLNVLGRDRMSIEQDELNELRKEIGFLFQSAALYDSMTVRENLEFPLIRNGIPHRETIPLVEEALDNVGLLDAINKMPSELSGGMRKRIGLARTLILKPKLMLYDEPTTGLDAITSREISDLIVEMQQKFNMTSIIITHDMPCAKITANRVVVLKDGLLIAEGTYEELRHSTDEKVKRFFE
jgi:phospholipid/cholesterol/gamma-HCH transport system ATP-binding protein